MNLVKKLVSENRLIFFVLVVTSILSGVLNALFLAVVTYSLARPETHTVRTLLIFAGACLGMLAIRQLHRYISIKVSNKTVNQLRIKLSRLINNSATISLEEKGNAMLLTILTADVGTITQFIMSIPNTLGNLAFLLGAMVYLAYLSDIALFAGMLGVIVVLMKVYGKVMAASKIYYQQARQEAEAMMGYQTDLVNGYKELKMDAVKGEKLVEECITPSNERLADVQLKAGMRHVLGLNVGAALIYTLIGVVLFTFPTVLNFPKEVVMGYILAIMSAANPLQSVMEIYPTFVRTRVAVSKIESLQSELEQKQERLGATPVPGESLSFSRIELSGVTFSYNGHDGDVTRLGPFNLAVNKGEVLFLCGGNGSGKTTLSKLICGLYAPDSGTIRINGKALEESALSCYRQHFSAVFSNFHIMRSSPEIYDLSQIPNNSLADGFDLDGVLFSKGGIIASGELSQGQRRRLAILMALDAEKPIYLFDEPGSDLDPDFKRFFYGTILSHLKARQSTVIVVTHDDNYFRYADRLVKLREGKIVEDMSVEGKLDLSVKSLEDLQA